MNNNAGLSVVGVAGLVGSSEGVHGLGAPVQVGCIGRVAACGAQTVCQRLDAWTLHMINQALAARKKMTQLAAASAHGHPHQ